MTRVTVAAPATKLELTLPPQATIAELVPQLARLAGGVGDGSVPARDVRGGAGWVLARAGGQALEPGATVAQVGIRDGEALTLRADGPRAEAQAHDDVAHVIAETIGQQGKWQPRWAALAVAVATCPAAVAIVPSATLPLAGLAIAMLAIAGLLRRKDPTAGAAIALSGLPAAAMAVRALVEPLGDIRFAAMCAAAVLYALAALVLAPKGVTCHVAVIFAAGVGFGAAVIGLATGIPDRTLSLAIVVGSPLLVPKLAALAHWVGGPEGVLSGGLAGAGLLVVATSQAHPGLALAAGLALILRSRAQSWILLVGGIATLASVAISHPALRGPIVLAVLAGAVVPWRRIPPRAFDIIEFIVLIGLIPLAIGVWHVDAA